MWGLILLLILSLIVFVIGFLCFSTPDITCLPIRERPLEVTVQNAVESPRLDTRLDIFDGIETLSLYASFQTREKKEGGATSGLLAGWGKVATPRFFLFPRLNHERTTFRLNWRRPCVCIEDSQQHSGQWLPEGVRRLTDTLYVCWSTQGSISKTTKYLYRYVQQIIFNKTVLLLFDSALYVLVDMKIWANNSYVKKLIKKIIETQTT